MSVNYTPFSESFSRSRRGMKWWEIDLFMEYIEQLGHTHPKILDIWCGNGRLLESLIPTCKEFSYLGIDESVGMIEEAEKLNPKYDFLVWNMKELDLTDTYDYIFFIASFHHLDTEESRVHTLVSCKKLLKPWGKIFLTNWNLIEQERYSTSITRTYEDNSADFSIKFGEYERYYHGFTLDSLQKLYKTSGFITEEHTIFETGRNIFSIITHGS